MSFEEHDLYAPGAGGYAVCRIPALLATENGTVLAFSEARRFTGRDSDQIDLLLRRSFDGGRSFEDVQVVATEDGWVAGNPAPVQDRDTGTVWLVFCRNRSHGFEAQRAEGEDQRTVWIARSDDDGATWSEPAEITGSAKRPEWFGLWYATGPGHGIQLQSGRLVVPCNHKETHGERRRGHSHVLYSDDHGASWSLGGSTDPDTSESRVLETADGWLYINCRSCLPATAGGGYFRRVAWSRDGGESFSPLVHDAGLPEPICQGAVCRYTLAANGPEGRGENCVLFSNPGNGREGGRSRLTVRLSYDECRTWPVARVVYEGPSAYSDLCVAPDGTICCLYEKGVETKPGVYAYGLALARFDLEWLTGGEDACE
jgi:sialidase-1